MYIFLHKLHYSFAGIKTVIQRWRINIGVLCACNLITFDCNKQIKQPARKIIGMKDITVQSSATRHVRSGFRPLPFFLQCVKMKTVKYSGRRMNSYNTARREIPISYYSIPGQLVFRGAQQNRNFYF